MIGHFLAGIAALIWRSDTNAYLLLRRAGSKDFGAGAWECVTGRVDQGESFGEAFVREVREEIGADIQFEFFVGSTHFYRGARIPENELLGLICCCTLTSGTEITLSEEHDDYQWLSPAEAAGFLAADHWLQPVLARAELFRQELPASLRRSLREHGIDML